MNPLGTYDHPDSPVGKNASAAPPIDVNKALQYGSNDRDLFIELLQIFVSHSTKLAKELKSAVAARDAKRIEDTAHALKGSAANLCAGPVREGARCLEEAGRTGNLQHVDAISRTLLADLEATHAYAAELQAKGLN